MKKRATGKVEVFKTAAAMAKHEKGESAKMRASEAKRGVRDVVSGKATKQTVKKSPAKKAGARRKTAD